MSETARHEALIQELARDLYPVHRLLPPWLRAAGWLAVVVALGAALASVADLDAIRDRLAAAPDMWLAVLGSTTTALLSAAAAFQTSVPDRSPRWALLPLPAAVLWIAASGAGCLRAWIVPGTHNASMTEARICLVFIVGVSLPLSVLLVAMLRRACPLRPNLTAALGGLAAASAAATLLNFFHPYDAAATDLIVHVFAIAMVIAANRLLAGRLLSRP
ncbi:MAG: DUF1109 family protein [Acetobacteraceae bacterium]|nr:DUF1109 family protein [Acetobacteraceae bacterium]MBV8577370.1 DUF1109 family protein [Acetobacteraceae bacterium]